MTTFRDHFRDLDGWSTYGIPFSTSSNEAVKLYDAALNQMLYYYNDPMYGGIGDTLQSMLIADPNFVSGNLLKYSLQLFVTDSDNTRKKFKGYCDRLDFDKLNTFEKQHIEAINCLAEEDLMGAMKTYANISQAYPYDLHSFNLGYVLGLITGNSNYLKDVPLAVVEKYKPHMPFYGLVHGKLCFGYAEMGDYDKAEKYGNIALESFPLDSWACHSMAHMYENQSKPKEEIAFLENSMKGWIKGVNFSHHNYWHNANAYVQIQDYESALTIYEIGILPCLKSGDTFPLSDASSLMLRLHIDGYDTTKCLKSLARMWAKHNDSFTSLFYDGHSCFTAAIAGDTANIDRLLENMKNFIASDRKGWNHLVTSKYGIDFVEGMRLLSGDDYFGATEKLKVSVPHAIKVMHGSKAQKSIFSLILIYTAIKSGAKEHLDLAEKHMEELKIWNNVSTLPPLQQRLWNKIQQQHGANQH